MVNEMVNLSSLKLRRDSSKGYVTLVYIKQFYSVGKRMPDAETTPVLQLPPTRMHFVTASCMYKYSHDMLGKIYSL